MTFARIIDIASSWAAFRPPTSLPAGLVVFFAGPTEEGIRIIEIWVSRDACAGGHDEFDISAHPHEQCSSRELDALLTMPRLSDVLRDPTPTRERAALDG